jgi:ABC-type nickel/cobalt efflux system permease component RcnA
MLAAAGIGFGHAALPDHWMPLAVLSRTRRYTTVRVLRLSLAASVAHVLVSLLLGGVLVLVGLRFRDTVAQHTDLVVGGILFATGLVFLGMELLGRGHGHSHSHEHGHDHDQEHDHGDHGHGEPGHDEHRHADSADHAGHAVHPDRRDARSVASFLVPFGAAASPDLTILPVFLAAGALGKGAAVGSLFTFAIATIATIVGLTTFTALGARQLTAPWIDRSANLLTAGTLVLVGGLVASGVI